MRSWGPRESRGQGSAENLDEIDMAGITVLAGRNAVRAGSKPTEEFISD